MSHPDDEEGGVVWDYIRPSSCFRNRGIYASPTTTRVHAFPAVPRTEPADLHPPVGGIGTEICTARHNPYKGGFLSFDLRFTYLSDGGLMSPFPGPGMYETRHLTSGALVKRPDAASPCFRRPEGRLDLRNAGTWHQETPLVSAENRGTVQDEVQVSPQNYSQGFKSKADRLIVNKPLRTTPDYVGPGCYDLAKDGKSVGIKTEKRVVPRTGNTNPFLTDWRTYMQLSSGISSSLRRISRGRNGRAAGTSKRKENSGPSTLDRDNSKPPRCETRDQSVSHAVDTIHYEIGAKGQKRKPMLERNHSGGLGRQQVCAGRNDHYQRGHHSTQEPGGTLEKHNCTSMKADRPRKRQGAELYGGAAGSKATKKKVEGSVSALGSGSGSTARKFVPRPPMVKMRTRPRTADSARNERVLSEENCAFPDTAQNAANQSAGNGRSIGGNDSTTADDACRNQGNGHKTGFVPSQRVPGRRPASASRVVRSSKDHNRTGRADGIAFVGDNAMNWGLHADGAGHNRSALQAAHVRRATADPGAAARVAAAIRASTGLSHE